MRKLTDCLTSSLKLQLTLLLIFLFLNSINAQDDSESASKTRLVINTSIIQLDSEYVLIANAKAKMKGEKRMQPVKDTPIQFFIVSEKADSLAGIVESNEKGESVFRIEKSQTQHKSDKGQLTFIAKFNGNDQFLSSSSETSVREVDLLLEFTMIDSVKSIKVTATERNEMQKLTPVDGTKIIFYVPRTFSLLKLAETVLYGGSASINFPETLPGDSLGNLTVIARIDDNDLYGTVETIGIKNWGEQRLPVVVEKRRGLGDTEAPLWMVYTLIVLLSAVWIHYLIVFFVIIQIKKNGSNIK